MHYTTIIFDMDGTIVDTEGIWVQATCVLLSRRGITVTPELTETINERVRGLHLIAICTELKYMFNLEDDVASLAREEEELAHSLYASHITFIEGFAQFHAQLKALNIKCAIATNATDSAIKKTNELLALDTFFGEHIYGVSRVFGKTKPAPDIFLYAAAQLGSDPSECIVIEDSAYGITAAKTAGMLCVGMNSCNNPLYTQQADLVVKNFTELDAQKLCNAPFAQTSLRQAHRP